MSGAQTSIMLQGELPGGQRIFACVDPSARYVNPRLCQFKFSAALAPYSSDEAARAALSAAGVRDVQALNR